MELYAHPSRSESAANNTPAPLADRTLAHLLKNRCACAVSVTAPNPRPERNLQQNEFCQTNPIPFSDNAASLRNPQPPTKTPDFQTNPASYSKQKVDQETRTQRNPSETQPKPNKGLYLGFFATDRNTATLLPYEVESYNSAKGAAALWVKVPTVSRTADTVIYLLYSQAPPAAVWDANFNAVYRLNAIAGTALADSTDLINNGASYSAIDGGNFPTGASTITMQAWVKFTASQNGEFLGLGDNSNHRFALADGSGNTIGPECADSATLMSRTILSPSLLQIRERRYAGGNSPRTVARPHWGAVSGSNA